MVNFKGRRLAGNPGFKDELSLARRSREHFVNGIGHVDSVGIAHASGLHRKAPGEVTEQSRSVDRHHVQGTAFDTGFPTRTFDRNFFEHSKLQPRQGRDRLAGILEIEFHPHPPGGIFVFVGENDGVLFLQTVGDMASLHHEPRRLLEEWAVRAGAQRNQAESEGAGHALEHARANEIGGGEETHEQLRR